MKSKIITFVFSVVLLCLTSCGGCTHNHANCTEHDHSHNNHAAPMQESFTVEADSLTVKPD